VQAGERDYRRQRDCRGLLESRSAEQGASRNGECRCRKRRKPRRIRVSRPPWSEQEWLRNNHGGDEQGAAGKWGGGSKPRAHYECQGNEDSDGDQTYVLDEEPRILQIANDGRLTTGPGTLSGEAGRDKILEKVEETRHDEATSGRLPASAMPRWCRCSPGGHGHRDGQSGLATEGGDDEAAQHERKAPTYKAEQDER